MIIIHKSDIFSVGLEERARTHTGDYCLIPV